MGVRAAAELRSTLDRLEAAYGRYVEPGNAVEAGAMALLAAHAPGLSSDASRDRLRQAFSDWNEARVSDAWDVTVALEATADPAARQFARALLRYLESLHGALNRCSFEVPPGEAKPDWVALLEKARAIPPDARACVLACLPETGGWHVSADMARVAVKHGLVGKTASATKVAQSLAEVCAPEDRLRLHYLLSRYAAREKDAPDPLAAAGRAKKAPREKSSDEPARKKPAKPKGAGK
jgi:hypothetical protein